MPTGPQEVLRKAHRDPSCYHGDTSEGSLSTLSDSRELNRQTRTFPNKARPGVGGTWLQERSPDCAPSFRERTETDPAPLPTSHLLWVWPHEPVPCSPCVLGPTHDGSVTPVAPGLKRSTKNPCVVTEPVPHSVGASRAAPLCSARGASHPASSMCTQSAQH